MNAELDMDPADAMLYAMHAVSFGPRVVGKILGCQDGSNGSALRDLLVVNRVLRPELGSPFVATAVRGVLAERGVEG
jgi:hypothetical protein